MRNKLIANKWFFILYTSVFIIAMLMVFRTEKGYVVLFFDKHRVDILNAVFSIITKIGEYYSYLFFIFMAIFVHKSYRKALAISSMGILLPLISYLLKMYFKHPRPLTYFRKYIDYTDFKGIEDMHYHTGHSSFPSGHTFAAFALFTLLTLSSKDKRWGILYFTLAISVGISRIYLFQHFLEDVIFGSLIGVLYGIITYYIFFVVLKDKSFFGQKN